MRDKTHLAWGRVAGRDLAQTGSIHVEYLPMNQAYLVMWLDQRLAGPMTREQANQWLADHDLRKGD